MLRLRHLGRLVGDLLAYTALTRSWWVLPVALSLVALLALASAGGATVPYAVYTLF